MKKLTAILLAASLALSLTACGGGDGSNVSSKTAEDPKETMLNSAVELDMKDLSQDAMENVARANSTYVGNTYKISGFVQSIESDHCILSTNGNYSDFTVHAYLDEEGLIQINPNEKITVVGEITEFNETTLSVAGYSFPEQYADMKPAYFVSNTTEMTGEIVRISSISGRKFCQIANTGIFLDGETLNNLKEGDKITVSGIMTYDPKTVIGGSVLDKLPDYYMNDAVLIEDTAK